MSGATQDGRRFKFNKFNINWWGNVASIIGLFITIIGFFITILTFIIKIRKLTRIHYEYIYKLREPELINRLTEFYKDISKSLNNIHLFEVSMDNDISTCGAFLESLEEKSPSKIKNKIKILRKSIKKFIKSNNILYNPRLLFSSKLKIKSDLIHSIHIELGALIEYMQNYREDQRWSTKR